MNTGQTSPPPLRGFWLQAARLLWLILIALSLVIVIAAVPVGFQSSLALVEALRPEAPYLSPQPVAVYLLAVQILFALGCILAALIIFWQRSDNRIALLASLVGGTFAVNLPMVFELNRLQVAWQPVIQAIIFFSQIGGIATSFLFPDGQFVPRWTRWPAGLLAAWYVAAVLFPTAPFNPEQIPLQVIFMLLLTCGGAAIFSQVHRYRHVSTPAQRQQTKWILFGTSLAIPCFVIAEMLFFIPALSQPGWPALTYQLILRPVFRLLILVAPLSILISILRYRLWDIDFVINRSLVYGVLSGLLAALLALSLYIVSLVFQNAAGGPLLAVAVSAAIFGAVFQPAHRRLQRFVDQRLYHIRVNYQQKPTPAAPVVDAAATIRETRFSAYRDMELIGHGGMAEVFKATHPTLGTPVAIKLLPAFRAADAQFRIRFQREAQAIARLQHPHIVRLFDFGEEGGIYFIVMEYIAGPPLDRWLREKGRMAPEQASPILCQVASALDYIHRQGLVHRDVKPSNVMLAPAVQPGASEFRAVLMDFGIAKLPGAHTDLTRTGTLGSFDYIAPEQIQASANVDHRADIYAFGVMAYQMLTGELPFKSSNPGALLIAHLTQPPPDPRKLAPDLPERATQALLHALAKDPAGRYNSAGEFAAELEAARF